MTTIRDAEQILKERLIGRAYTCVSLCDSWSLQFYDGIWLVAQRIETPDDIPLTKLLSKQDTPFLDGVDASEIPVAISILRYRRQLIREVVLEEDGSLTLAFEGSGKLQCSVDSPEVDWQWVVNTSGADPYIDFTVACFSQGEIEVAPK